MLEKLPRLGFDVGKKAIKIDDRLALKIMEAWKQDEKRQREASRIAEIRGTGVKEEGAKEAVILEIKIPPIITVRDFATALGLPISKVLTALMKNGVLASMNERIDFDTASITGEELGYKILVDDNEQQDSRQEQQQNKLDEILGDKHSGCVERPPIIVVMGHVDHGKTKILDAIRKTDVISGESGGITQHIGAYQVHRHGRTLTFIDTPGHEAFTAMRSRGARVADVAILVIAADDSVRPQTLEAIKIISDAKLPFVVAVNKIDKDEADLEKVKQDLSSINLRPEDWGGDVVCLPVSAKTGQGIDELLDTVLLVADMEKELLLADCDRLAIGTVIESHVDKGEGPVATMIVQSGTLRVGDALGTRGSLCGKARSLKNYQGENISEAGPGTPAKILGLKISPEVGSVLEVPEDSKSLSKDIKQHLHQQNKSFSVLSSSQGDDSKSKNINLIIKADVLGSLEAIIESLAKLETAEIKIKIVSKGLGIISESDVFKAEATGAQIFGFHVKPLPNVADLARDKKVAVKTYKVIYHLLEDIQEQIKDLQIKEAIKLLVGKLEVLKIFRKESHNTILGGRVTEGHLVPTEIVIVVRGSEAMATGKVMRLECSHQLIEKVAAGQECGLSFEGKAVIEPGDVLEFYIEEK
jgi:translation initiation factor IF-2